MRRFVCALIVLAATGASWSAPSPAGAAPPDRIIELGAAPDAGSPVVSDGRRAVGVVRAGAGSGYWVATDDGGVQSFGGAPFHGSAGAHGVASPIVAIAARPAGDGYWLAAADGGVFAFGAAPFRGSLGGVALRAPVVGIAGAPDGDGYWLAAADGGVFAFGSARYLGGLGDRPLAAPVVAVAALPARDGYWLAAADGGVFAFGAARFRGSAAGAPLRSPIAAIASTTTGDGYWLAATDGGVFTYGDAGFHGAGSGAPEPVVGIAPSRGSGYWLLRSPVPPPQPPLPSGSGSGRRIVYSNPQQRVWVVDPDGTVVRSYLVSGKRGIPAAGTYRVFSKSRHASAGHDGITMDDMVRFARGADGLAIGFHGIPRDARGRPLQTEDDLGGFRSAGCVRQSTGDAAYLFDWAPVGTTVVVTH